MLLFVMLILIGTVCLFVSEWRYDPQWGRGFVASIVLLIGATLLAWLIDHWLGIGV